MLRVQKLQRWCKSPNSVSCAQDSRSPPRKGKVTGGIGESGACFVAWAWWVCQNPLLISQGREWDEWGSWSSYWFFNGIPPFFNMFPDTSGNISSIFLGIVYLYMGFPIFGFAMTSGYSLTPMKMSRWPSSSWENHPSLDSRETMPTDIESRLKCDASWSCESCYAETCARIAGSIFDYFAFSRSLAFPGAFEI